MIYIDGIITQLQRSGGISVYFNEIVKRLARDNVNFVFESYGNGNLLDGIASELSDGTWVQRSPRRLERYRRSPVTKSASVFHSTYYRVPQDPNVATVTTVHDFTYERMIGGLRTAVHRRQKNAAIRHADAVICVSHATRRDLLDIVDGCDPGKVHVIHNGVSENFSVLPSVKRNDRPIVIFVGARSGYKNFDLAVRVVSRLGDHDLIAVGGGPLSAAERSLVSRYLPDRFNHVGFVSNAELNALYNTAAFLLYPSSYEGFGLPILEAMKAGCAVVAVSSSSICEVAGSAAYLAQAPNEDALWESVNLLTNCSEERDRRISLGQKWATNFSWERSYLQTCSIYRDLSQDSMGF